MGGAEPARAPKDKDDKDTKDSKDESRRGNPGQAFCRSSLKSLVSLLSLVSFSDLEGFPAGEASVEKDVEVWSLFEDRRGLEYELTRAVCDNLARQGVVFAS